MAEAEALLGVNCSLLGRRWLERPCDDAQLRNMTQRGLPEILARVLAARKVRAEESDVHLEPRLRDLMPDPSTLEDMDAAVDCFCRAIKDGRKIGIIADYDADGASSCALVKRYLAALGKTAEVHVPDRKSEGYGPSPEAFGRLRDSGVKVVLLVDCGVSSPEALRAAWTMGLDTLIFDHHACLEGPLPQACAVINPSRPDDRSGLGHLAAAGVVFLFLVACNRALRERGEFVNGNEPKLLKLLDLVALATICDVVPLVLLNRAFVRGGVSVLQNGGNPGLLALARKAGLEGNFNARDFGFALGPRVNAAGRIGNAKLAVRLLCTDDAQEAGELAARLDSLNQKRQEIELRMLDQATHQIEAAQRQHDPVVFAWDQSWNSGVIGIVANRIKERYRRTGVVMGKAVDAEDMRGSCRSVGRVDIGAIILEAVGKGVLAHGGGHRRAAGFTVKKEKIPDFFAFVQERAERAGEWEEKDYFLDGVLGLRAVDLEWHDLLERAGPYGKGNEAPSFAFASVKVVHSKLFGRDLKHVSCVLSGMDGARLPATAFHAALSPLGKVLSGAGDRLLHVAGHLEASEWRGKRRLRLLVGDVAQCG